MIISCDAPVNNSLNMEKPIMVPKSNSEDRKELGIDSEFRLKSGIQIMWYSSDEIGRDFYAIYRGSETSDSTINFSEITKVYNDDILLNDTVYLDTTVILHKKYYYFIRSIGTDGSESNPSDTVSYILNESPYIISPVNTISDSFPEFNWIDNSSIYHYSNEFVIRIENLEENNLNAIWIAKFYNIWFGLENYSPISFRFFPATCEWSEDCDTFHLNAPSNIMSCYGLKEPLLEGSYRWKLKSISLVNNDNGMDESSGESPWKYFNAEY